MRWNTHARRTWKDGLRSLCREWPSTLAVVAILATGIAAATAAFAIVDTFLLRPVPGVVDEASLVTVRFSAPGRRVSAYGTHTALPALREAGQRAGLAHLSWACCLNRVAYAASADTSASFEGVDFVSSEYFATLGVTPVIGRLITDAETDELAFVAVISERLWRRDFNADPNVVGRRVWLNQHAFTVVGVLKDFRGWDFSKVGATDLWAPLSTIDTVRSNGFPSMSVLVGRLAPGADAGIVEQALQRAYANADLAAHYLAWQPYVEQGLYPANQLTRVSRTLAWTLALSAALVLLLASANAANVLLIRVGARHRAHAIRSALGAPLHRVALPFVVESCVLSVAAGLAGLAVAHVALSSLGAFRMLAYFPDLSHVTFDIRVVIAAGVTSLAITTLASLLPLVTLTRTDLTPLLARHSAGPLGRLWARKGLLVVQIALTVPIAATTVVLHRELTRTLGEGPAVDIDHVMTVSVRPENAGYDREQTTAYLRAAIESLTASGFNQVSMSYPEFAGDIKTNMWFQRADDTVDRLRLLRVVSVSPSFFDVVGARLVAGRFPDKDVMTTELAPVVISRSLAEDLFVTSEQAVGQPVRFGFTQALPAPNGFVAAVVADAGVWPASTENVGQVFHMGAAYVRSGQMLVRFSGAEARAADAIRAALTAVSRDVPIDAVQPLHADLRNAMSTAVLLAKTGLFLSAIAIILAVAGSAAVVNQLVRTRRDEFAIRLALGARPASVTLGVLRTVWISIAIGGAIGMLLYLPIPRLLASAVTRTTGFDMLALGAALLIVAIAVTLAAVEPAARAGRVQPAELLRGE